MEATYGKFGIKPVSVAFKANALPAILSPQTCLIFNSVFSRGWSGNRVGRTLAFFVAHLSLIP